MNKSNNNGCVLFSPIGSTDPVKNRKDGPMLNIVRNYKPKEVYLFFSKKMLEKDKKDDRYKKAIELVLPNCKVEKIESKIEEPHKFDEYLDNFKEEIQKIADKNHPNTTIPLNVSSGTPQMQIALCLEAVGNISLNLKAIQVEYHPPKGNEGNDFRVEELDFLNKKIEDKRTLEPQLLIVKKSLIKKQIETLVKKYEYSAALKIINHLPSEIKNIFGDSDSYILIKYAKYKLYLDNKEAEKTIKKLKNEEIKKNLLKLKKKKILY